MTREQIEQWAIEADQGHAGMDCLGFGGSIVSVSTLERFAALVAAHEREQCALVCDGLEVVELSQGLMLPASNRHCAQAIRARGEVTPSR